ncbi:MULTISPECIES: hypothetical protein [unclassified Sulfuricurvum]|uniref:hypothetical protein n=1 Tax=unclassified Sulfuricurvum TaxID=2632390 RepID=UPI0003254DCA|nr:MULTISPECIES: hypothetical protein [unclassified Sulfuricurvum]OHD85576.1 MAG: hypothetical protein A3I60_00240 [Sulfuricurvum sp. RIFCSPLOWO2_02_FULL_43_45]OHD87353.1 MAG: hypothetical protein A2W83_06700 [Sulfuricurvum sp. RIFCSPLOWO2_12_43_5]
MQRFRRFFSLLFILSIFVGAVHEIEHSYHQDSSCEICLFAHSPLILNDTFTLPKIDCATVIFDIRIPPLHFVSFIPAQSRSPPLV